MSLIYLDIDLTQDHDMAIDTENDKIGVPLFIIELILPGKYSKGSLMKRGVMKQIILAVLKSSHENV